MAAVPHDRGESGPRAGLPAANDLAVGRLQGVYVSVVERHVKHILPKEDPGVRRGHTPCRPCGAPVGPLPGGALHGPDAAHPFAVDARAEDQVLVQELDASRRRGCQNPAAHGHGFCPAPLGRIPDVHRVEAVGAEVDGVAMYRNAAGDAGRAIDGDQGPGLILRGAGGEAQPVETVDHASQRLAKHAAGGPDRLVHGDDLAGGGEQELRKSAIELVTDDPRGRAEIRPAAVAHRAQAATDHRVHRAELPHLQPLHVRPDGLDSGGDLMTQHDRGEHTVGQLGI